MPLLGPTAKPSAAIITKRVLSKNAFKLSSVHLRRAYLMLRQSLYDLPHGVSAASVNVDGHALDGAHGNDCGALLTLRRAMHQAELEALAQQRQHHACLQQGQVLAQAVAGPLDSRRDNSHKLEKCAVSQQPPNPTWLAAELRVVVGGLATCPLCNVRKLLLP